MVLTTWGSTETYRMWESLNSEACPPEADPPSAENVKCEAKKNKIRLDELLVQKKIAETRSRARALILAGEVQVDCQTIDKAGALVSPDANVIVRTPPKYVGRGGTKLEKALLSFGIEVTDCVCVDVGASTGGFTDCLLQQGAKKVYAIDVGYGQMHWRLQSDDRVARIDRENFRNFTVSRITDPVDLVVMDVSFISITLLLPKVVELFRAKPSHRKKQQFIALVKPQFEAGKKQIGKGGIVREAAVHEQVVEKIKEALNKQGFSKIHVTESPLQGADGNKEFLISGDWKTTS